MCGKLTASQSHIIDPLLELAPQQQLPDGRYIADLQPSFDGQLIKLGPIFTKAS